MSVSKFRPKNEFSFRENSHVIKIWTTTFPKEFFNKIWLKVREHEYIYIFEIKLEKKKKKLFCFKMHVTRTAIIATLTKKLTSPTVTFSKWITFFLNFAYCDFSKMKNYYQLWLYRIISGTPTAKEGSTSTNQPMAAKTIFVTLRNNANLC